LSRSRDVIDKFNANSEPCLLFIGIKAGGKGLCIERANKIIIFEPLWNPDTIKQAIGRADRTGQKNDIDVYILVTENSIEMHMCGQSIFREQRTALITHRKPFSYFPREVRRIIRSFITTFNLIDEGILGIVKQENLLVDNEESIAIKYCRVVYPTKVSVPASLVDPKLISPTVPDILTKFAKESFQNLVEKLSV
jgi:hypothetical protein